MGNQPQAAMGGQPKPDSPTPQSIPYDAADAVVIRRDGTVVRTCEWCQGAMLTGRQIRFCSDAHRSAWWEHHHPRLGTLPVIPDGRSIDRIVAVCADGRWRTIPEIAHDTGTREVTVARRIREVQTGRKGRAIARFTWDQQRRARSLAMEYRLVLNAASR